MRLLMPSDGWGEINGDPVIPRQWQIDAMKTIINHYSQPKPNRGVCHAVTGSGKSLILAQLCACIQVDSDDAIVVSTSRQKLVRQITETIKDRMESCEFMAPEVVGSYWAESKDVNHRIIVACNDSLKNLAEALNKIGRRTAWYCCDELHRSESKTMKEAYDLLMPVMAIGFSATPYRSNEKQGISNFDTVIVKYGLDQALADGCVVPWVVKHWEGGEVSLDEACLDMMKEEGGRTIVNAFNIEDAIQFSKFCSDNGYSMRAVHSKQTHTENNEIIEEMKTGKIQAVCHVDTLSEGVDIREIMTICLRRIVASRNRFVQELGRGIRAFTDKITGVKKERLTVLDPSELINRFRLDYSAVLSGDFDCADIDDEKTEGEKLEKLLQNECFEVLRHLTAVKAGKQPLSSEPLASYLSQLASVFDTFGLMQKPINCRDWRRASASEKQLTTMTNMKWALGRKAVPSIHRTALEILTTVGQINRGMASDLISIQISLAEKSKWPNFSQLDQCVKDGLERHEKRKLRPPAAPKAMLQAPQGPKLEQGVLFEGIKPK